MKEKSIKNIGQEFKQYGIFYTPSALAERNVLICKKNENHTKQFCDIMLISQE